MRPLLLSEDNPYSQEPRFALYPLPERASGGRLARALGLSARDYLRAYDRQNLCAGSWDPREAARSAEVVLRGPGRVVVGLGVRVRKALGVADLAVGQTRIAGRVTVAALPHPSGLCRDWNDPVTLARVRAVLRAVGAPCAAPPTVDRAACRWRGVVYSAPRPARHHDVLHAIAESLGGVAAPHGEVEQGFLDDLGRFLTREQAGEVATLSGQLRDAPLRDGRLYSEDLW